MDKGRMRTAAFRRRGRRSNSLSVRVLNMVPRVVDGRSLRDTAQELGVAKSVPDREGGTPKSTVEADSPVVSPIDNCMNHYRSLGI